MRRSRPAIPFRLSATAAALVMLAGCTVGPDYEQPEVAQIPESFRFEPEQTLGDADTEWWREFGDPVLEGLIDEALRNNYDVRIAAARVEEFAARVGITRSAAFPQVEYGAGGERSQNSRELAAGRAPGAERISDFFNANLNVGWELDLWGRIRRSEEAAIAQLLSAEESRRGVILTLVTGVATGYVGLRSLDEQLAIAQERLETRKETLDLFELRAERGVISDLEVAQVRSEYERTATTIPQIEREIAQLENSLSVLLGRAPGPIPRGARIDSILIPAVPPGVPAELLRRRPDLRAAEQDLVAANALVGAAVAEFYPRVSLTGLFGFASDDLSDLLSSSASIYNLAANIAGPIFTAGRLEGQVDAAEAATDAALNTYINAILVAFRETEDALVVLRTTRDELEAQTRQVDALAAYTELAELRYDNGYVDYIEVLDAERDLFDTRLENTRLQADRIASVIGVYKALGGGWVEIAETTSNRAETERAEADATRTNENGPS
ncbi:MAG: efflux transporter outer membrane subunit [Planctomycetota bacterium]